MVAGSAENDGLCKKVAEIYDWIETRISDGNKQDRCKACGKCCDFEAFDHRLFITPPELMYLMANLGYEKIRPMPTGKCPYNIESKCTVYEYRFAGCRIFFCSGDAEFQSELSEAALKKIKSLCVDLYIPYCYSYLANALNGFVSD
jgi:hypothetical protein